MASRILVVEDAPEYREYVTQSLRDEGFEVMTAEDGRMARQAIENDHPDAVICDAVLPRQTGFSLLNELRADNFRIPVILTSSWDNAVARDLAKDLGAAAFVPKDTKPAVLLRALRSCLARRTECRVPPPPGEIHEVISQGRFSMGNAPRRVLTEFCRETADILQELANGDRIRLAQAVTRAARVVILRGNLELATSEWDNEEFDAIIAARATESPFDTRRVQVMVVLETDRIRVTMADQGPGLDYRTLTDSALAPVQSLADHVGFSADGRRIELTCRLERPLSEEAIERLRPAPSRKP